LLPLSEQAAVPRTQAASAAVTAAVWSRGRVVRRFDMVRMTAQS
jgi:hypothetical protein